MIEGFKQGSDKCPINQYDFKSVDEQGILDFSMVNQPSGNSYMVSIRQLGTFKFMVAPNNNF